MHITTAKDCVVKTVNMSGKVSLFTPHGHVKQKRAFFQDRRMKRSRTRQTRNSQAMEW